MKSSLNMSFFVSCLCVLACAGCSREQPPPQANGPKVENQPVESKRDQVAEENQAKPPPSPVAATPDKPGADKEPSPVPRKMKSYYYDVVTGGQFVAESDELPPIIRENGNKAFKAYVFTCGSCSNESERFVGYYEGFTDDFKKKRAAAIEAAKVGELFSPEMLALEEGISGGRLISTDAKIWGAFDSPEGIEINIALVKACDGKDGELKLCFPGLK